MMFHIWNPESLYFLIYISKTFDVYFSLNREPQLISQEKSTFTPLLTLRDEFRLPTKTPRRSNNFLKGCKW